MSLEFEITLQSDAELIWKHDGTNRRVVVRKLELRVPVFRFTGEGQKIMNENFLRPRKITYLRENLNSSTSMRQANGTWSISPGVKNVKHVFMFFQQARKVNALTQNPYFFDTFDIDGDNSAKLSTCRLQYGSDEFYPDLEYDGNFRDRILDDLINYRYHKNDYNSGVQLYPSNFESLYPVIYFDLRENKQNITNEPRQLVLHYKLNEAANAQDYTIYAAILFEESLVIKEVGQELVIV